MIDNPKQALFRLGYIPTCSTTWRICFWETNTTNASLQPHQSLPWFTGSSFNLPFNRDQWIGKLGKSSPETIAFPTKYGGLSGFNFPRTTNPLMYDIPSISHIISLWNTINIPWNPLFLGNSMVFSRFSGWRPSHSRRPRGRGRCFARRGWWCCRQHPSGLWYSPWTIFSWVDMESDVEAYYVWNILK